MLQIKGLSRASIDLLVQNNGGKPPKTIRVRAYIDVDGTRYQWAHKLLNDRPPYQYTTGLIALEEASDDR